MTTYIYSGDKRRARLDEIQSKRIGLLADIAAAEDAVATPGEYAIALRQQLSCALDDASLPLRARQVRYAGRERPGKLPPWIEPDKALTLADLTWLFGLEETVRRICTANGIEDAEGTMAIAERHAKLNALHEDLHATEIEEEREMLALQAIGIMPLRREDADPNLLLQIWQAGHEPMPKLPPLSIDRIDGSNESIRSVEEPSIVGNTVGVTPAQIAAAFGRENQ